MAAVRNFIVAIELGSTKITGIAGQKRNDGSIAVLAVVSEDSTQCIRKGVVYNIDKTVQCITNIIQRLRSQLHVGIKHVFIGVGGQSIHSVRNVVMKDLEEGVAVSPQLVVEMMDQNRGMEYPEMEILDVEPQEYRADSLFQSDPVGIQCSHLEGNFLNILQSRRHYNKLIDCFDKADVKIAEMYLAPFALADAVLTPVEKRSGCMLVDLGADTTTVMVYHKEIVRHIAVIPLGANNITKDICSLHLEEAEAEKLKLQYASAYTPVDKIDPTLRYDVDNEQKIDSTHFIDLVEARVQEIIANAWNQVPSDFVDKLMGGIVLTGGGSNLRNIDEAFRMQTKIEKVRIAKFVTMTVESTNPAVNEHNGTMNTVIGLLAKGDQNCYQPQEETKRPDMFGVAGETGTESASPEAPVSPRDANSLPQGVVLTPSEKAAAEKAAAEQEARRKAEEEAKRVEEELAAQAAEEERKKKGGLKSKVIKFLTSITEPGE